MKITSRTDTITSHTLILDNGDDTHVTVTVTAPLADYIDPFVSEDGKKIVVALHDSDPCNEYEFPDGVEFVQANNRNKHYCNDVSAWITEQRDEAGKAVFPVGVYEHGLIQYALAGESIHAADPFDYCVGAMIALPTGEDGYTDPEGAARAILAEYTAYCNGDAYGIATLTRGDDDEWTEDEVVWGFLGSDSTAEIVKSGGY